MKNKFLFAAIGVIIILQLVTLFAGKGNVKLGGTTADDLNVGGNLAVTGTATVTGETNLDTLVQGGAVATITTASSTLTAAQICDSAIIKFNSANDAINSDTIYLASSTAMIADCLPTIGDSKQVKFWNYSTTTYAVVFNKWGAAALIDLDIQSTSTDAAGDLVLTAGDFAWVVYQNLNGATSTVTWLRLTGK